ncbi:hypothetical protein [Streptomyces sp. NBC_00470]|uniref:hypothetical protein n=1 Tax=Streptomyces sp. NBC_00470 TaxID=2975753 RepID=UPI0030E14883
MIDNDEAKFFADWAKDVAKSRRDELRAALDGIELTQDEEKLLAHIVRNADALTMVGLITKLRESAAPAVD